MLAVLDRLRKAAAPAARITAAVPRRMRAAALAVAGLGLVAACEPVTTTQTTAPTLDRDRPVQVALLVPAGSGQSGDAALANSLENAARMAVADLGTTRIELRIYDTAGDPARAAQQATRAVNEGAQIILGPVFAASARSVGAALAGTGVPVLSFSNNPRVASGDVFILGPTFDNTARRLVSHAMTEDKRRFLTVAERNESGEIGAQAIAAAIARSGAGSAGTETFDFSQQGVVDAVPRIAEAARNGGADAIFFTSNTAGALPLLVQLLPENRTGTDRFQYIGLTRWDIPAAILELPGVQGAWFALPDPAMTRRFNQRYASAHGRDPHPIAGLAYDGIAAVGALVRTGRPDALSRASLTQAQGFAGVAGVFRLLPDGTNERSLAVAEIRNQEVVVISPAQRSFAGPGL